MLIKCPDCSKEVSDQAVQCIGCGAPLVEPRWWKRWPAKTVYAGVGLMCLGLLMSPFPAFGIFLLLVGSAATLFGFIVIKLGTE